MAHEYVVRASLDMDIGWMDGARPGVTSARVPTNLPRNFGEFMLNNSPNDLLYLDDIDWFDPENRPELPTENFLFPRTLFYIEFRIEVDNPDDRYLVADEKLERLEALMRLFQVGYISVRRDGIYVVTDEGVKNPPGSFRHWFNQELAKSMNVKPIPYRRDQMSSFDFEDDRFENFIAFFETNWKMSSEKPFLIPLVWFSKSYEAIMPADRLVALLISLESIFGEIGETTYKIATRCSCFIYPPGEARQKTSERLKKLYGERSRILHGDRLNLVGVSNEDIDNLEEYSRQALAKLLTLYAQGQKFKNPNSFDRFVFLPWNSASST